MQPPSADLVRAQLERILLSPTFATSTRLRAFLRYVVERTLAGEAGELKEYAIGVDVFERTGEYDPRIDSIVRVEAGRLRAKLDEFYAADGSNDPVIVSMPRGSYVPVFEAREVLPAHAPAAVSEAPSRFRFKWPAAVLLVVIAAMPGIALWRPAGESLPLGQSVPRPMTDFQVAVLPFTHYAEGGADAMLAARITDGVMTELARINVVGVISRTTSRRFEESGRSLTELPNSTNAIEGSVYSQGDVVRVRTRIVGRSNMKTAVRDFEGRRDRVDELVQRIAEALSASFQARSLR
jgi:TolB-like protein